MRTTLRRFLKYSPVLMLGLLVVAWVVSWFGLSVIAWQIGERDGSVMSTAGSLWLSGPAPFGPQSVESNVYSHRGFEWGGNNLLGMLHADFFPGGSEIVIPYPLLLSLLLPVAIGPFLSFRFRLWHYLAYTALVALELAYYLRLQE